MIWFFFAAVCIWYGLRLKRRSIAIQEYIEFQTKLVELLENHSVTDMELREWLPLCRYADERMLRFCPDLRKPSFKSTEEHLKCAIGDPPL